MQKSNSRQGPQKAKAASRIFSWIRIIGLCFSIAALFYVRESGGAHIVLSDVCNLLKEVSERELPELCDNPTSATAVSSSTTGFAVGILSIAVTEEGYLNVTVSSEDFTTIPSPLGSFGPYHTETITWIKSGDTLVDPAQMFPGRRTLTLYNGPQQWVYDLGDQAFEISLRAVEATIWNDPQTGNVSIKILDEANYTIPPVFIDALEAQQAARETTNTSNCLLARGNVITVTENARTWPGPNVTNSNFTSTLSTQASYYILNGPNWGPIRWDTDHQGWWWEISYAENGPSAGWIWEGRIVECL